MPEDVQVAIRVNGESIHGDLALVPSPLGLVVFAHGSGSSRHSPRNRRIAAALRDAGFATLLVDLLTESEADVDLVTRHLRSDVALHAARLELTVNHLRGDERTRGLSLGIFGAGTGAAAAVITAARAPGEVGAIVSRGGRPDLAPEHVPLVKAPTLLVVAERDTNVLHANRLAQQQMTNENEIEIVRGATHLFEEAGALEHVCRSAVRWFEAHLEGRSP